MAGGSLSGLSPSRGTVPQRHAAPTEIKAEEPESDHPAAGVVGLSVKVWSPSEQGEGATGEKAPPRDPLTIPGFPRPSVGSGGKGMARRTGHRGPGLQDPEGLPGLVRSSAGSGVHDLVPAPATQAGTHLSLFCT